MRYQQTCACSACGTVALCLYDGSSGADRWLCERCDPETRAKRSEELGDVLKSLAGTLGQPMGSR